MSFTQSVAQSVARSVSHCVLRVSVVMILALSTACATYTQPGGDVAPEAAPVEKPPLKSVVKPPVPGVYETPPRSATHSASAAWQPLLAKAEQATERGDFEQALALLERAQRIDPDSAEVYLSIAEMQRAKGDAAQARAAAERGLLYCSSAAICDALRAFVR
jgi:tetratricopeptide (TPR) repeat protein